MATPPPVSLDCAAIRPTTCLNDPLLDRPAEQAKHRGGTKQVVGLLSYAKLAKKCLQNVIGQHLSDQLA